MDSFTILELKRTDLNEFFECTLSTGSVTDYRRRTRVYIDGQKYTVQQGKQLNEGSSPKIWKLLLRRIKQQTKNNYDFINFTHIISIERISQTKIEMLYSDLTKFIIELDNSEECLKEYVLLVRMRREANSNYGPNGLE